MKDETPTVTIVHEWRVECARCPDPIPAVSMGDAQTKAIAHRAEHVAQTIAAREAAQELSINS